MDIKDIIAGYDALVARALDVVGGAPYWRFVGEKAFVRISIDGDTATLTWPDQVSSFGDYYIEPESVEFPVDLLTMDDREFSAWKDGQLELYEKKKEADRREAIRAARDKELQVLAALRAKYEGTAQ